MRSSIVYRAHATFAFCLQNLFRQVRDGHIASADPLQVIHVERGRVVDGLAMFGEVLAGLDDSGEFTRWQTYRLAPVALQGCDLPEPFRLGLRFGLEKLPASIKRTEIEIPGMRFAVAIFENSKGGALRGLK